VTISAGRRRYRPTPEYSPTVVADVQQIRYARAETSGTADS
jgi:hypothetical protein